MMTQPYPPQYGAPQQAPQQPWAPQPQAYGYPPQQPAYPAQNPYPGPYGQPQQQAYAPPAPQAPAQQPVSASLGDFYNQPSTGWGPSVTPTGKTPDGTAILMVVAQHITKAHVEHAKKYKSEELDYYRNGMAKLQMKLPVNVAPGTQYMTDQGAQTVADGRAQYILKGNNKDLVGAAIAATGGNPSEPPELGSIILATKTHNRQTTGQPSPVVTFQYWKPGPEAAQMAAQYGIAYPDLNTPKPADGGETGGNAAAQGASAGPAVNQKAASPQPVGQPPAPMPPAAPPQMPPPGQYAPAPGQVPHPTPAAPPAPAPAAQAAPPNLPPAPVAPGVPAGMSQDNAGLLASLLGGSAPAAPPAA